MKSLIVAALLVISMTGSAFAQTVPSANVKGTGISINGLSLNFSPVLDLVGALQAKGAKVEMTTVLTKGIELLYIKVDGKQLSPVVLSCKNCEPIVFEY